MSTDAERLLKHILDKAKKTNSTDVQFNIADVNNIPNIGVSIERLLYELEEDGMLIQGYVTLDGNVQVYLTTDGSEYSEQSKNVSENKGEYVNVFYGDVKGVQIQQGNINSNQTQTIVNEEAVDYEKIRQVINEIKKYESEFDDIYHEDASKVRRIVEEVLQLTEQKKDVGKIKKALTMLKDISAKVVGNLITTGITEMIKSFGI